MRDCSRFSAPPALRRVLLGVLALLGALVYLAAACWAGPEQDLYAAIRTKDVQKVRAALARLPGPLQKPPEGELLPPVAFATVFGSTAVVEALLDAGYPVDQQGLLGVTPLFFATDVRMAELLGKRGANVNRRNTLGETPLDWAVRRKDSEVADALRKRGARHSPEFGIRLSDANGWTEYLKPRGGGTPDFGTGVFVAKLKNYRPTEVPYVEVRCDWHDASNRLVGSARTFEFDLKPGEIRFVRLEARGIPFPKVFKPAAREVDSPF